LTDQLKEFIEAYPEIEVTLVVSEDELDLSMGEADVAVRMNPPRQPDLIQRRLATMHHRAFAAPAYINTHGMPHSFVDLDHHQLIGYDDTFYPPFVEINWMLKAGLDGDKSRRPVLRVNSTGRRPAASALHPCPIIWARLPAIWSPY